MIRKEFEKTLEFASKSPATSPWGKARPVKVNNVINDDFPDMSIQIPKTPPTQYVAKQKTPKFEDIIKRQAAAEQNRITRFEKSLETIEIEEKAILELQQYYKTLFPSDRISVTRVNKEISVPLWSAKT